MPCFSPLRAYQCFDGRVVFDEVRKYDIVRTLDLPCGRCIGCRLEKSRQWAVRCMHEAQMHRENCFVTLTYNDEHLPRFGSLHYSDFQAFMRRLRKRFKRCGKSIRFYMCGEYGEQLGRPHYHACLFGIDFADRELLRSTPAGFKIYRSAILEALWPFGHSSIGDVTFESAAYTARYICDKMTGDVAKSHYEVVEVESGEIGRKVPEFARMSLKPGIGATWLEKFRPDVYPNGRVVARGGISMKAPRYYDKKFEEYDFEAFDSMVFRRGLAMRDKYEDNTPERLLVKQKIVKARMKFLKRENIS